VITPALLHSSHALGPKFILWAMTTTLVAPTEQHLQVVSNLEAWKRDGADRVRRFKAAESASEMGVWEIGDWLIEGLDDKEFGTKAYEEAEQITGWQRETLYTVVWVVRKFPPSLRSETALKWSHFKELARIKDENVREKALHRFTDDGFEHSVLDVRSYVDRVLEKLKAGKPKGGKQGNQKTYVQLTVSLKADYRDLVKAYAKAKRTTPELLLREIVMEYLEDNKKEVAAKIESARKSQSSKKPVNGQ